MVENKVSPTRFSHVRVEFVRRRRRVRQKAKFSSMDNTKISQVRIDGENTPYEPIWTSCTLDTLKFPRSHKMNASGATHLSLSQGKKMLNFQESFVTSMDESDIYNTTDQNTLSIDGQSNNEQRKSLTQTRRKWMSKDTSDPLKNQSRICRNCSCKNFLIISITSLLGFLAIVALILPNVLLYLMLPTLFQSLVNQSNLTQPMIYANHCGGVSPYTRWDIYFTLAINMSIDTRNCSFNSTPLYYTSITGYNLHNNLVSNNAIYTASKSGFYLYVRSYSGWNISLMYSYSQTQKWNISWIGIYH